MVDRMFLLWKKRYNREFNTRIWDLVESLLLVDYSGSKFARMRYLLIILFVFNALLIDKFVFFFEKGKFCNETFLSNLSWTFFQTFYHQNVRISKLAKQIHLFFLLYFTSVFKIQNQTCLTGKEMIEFEHSVYVNESSSDTNSKYSPT